MNKNKTIGIFFCIIAVVLFIGIFIFSADIRGYNKFLDKYFLAIKTGNAKEYSDCYISDDKAVISDAYKNLLDDKNKYLAENDNKDYFENALIKYKIKSREKLDAAKISRLNEEYKVNSIGNAYILKLEVMINIENDSYTNIHNFIIAKVDNKWKIITQDMT